MNKHTLKVGDLVAHRWSQTVSSPLGIVTAIKDVKLPSTYTLPYLVYWFTGDKKGLTQEYARLSLIKLENPNE